MSLREALRKPAVGGTVAGIVAVIAIFIGLSSTGEPLDEDIIDSVYYIDLQTKEVFAGPAFPKGIAPIKAPSGGDGVLAYIYSCGTCDASEWKVEYLEKYSDAAVTEFAKPDGTGDKKIIGEGRMFTRPDDEDWLPITDEKSAKVIEVSDAKCPGKYKPCLP